MQLLRPARQITLATLLVGAMLAAASAAAGSPPAGAAPKATLTVATLAPRASLWGKVMAAWSKAVARRTRGALHIRFYWNGAQGDEATVVAKMRSGQLDGATLGAGGLSLIYRPALALQLPGLFTTWRSIDRARNALYPELRDAFAKRGFLLSSIGDVGRARTFSKGRAIRRPADLRGMKPAGPRRGLIAPALASVLGISLVPTSVGELPSALSSGRINVIVAPALVAEQMQWAPYFDHLGADVSGIAVGAMVLSRRQLEAQPADVLEAMRRSGHQAGRLLTRRLRKQDQAAFRRLGRRMTVVRLSASERSRWAQVFARVRHQLGRRTFGMPLVRRLEALAGAGG